MNNSNGDANRVWKVDGEVVRGVGSFHKTLPHNEYGEVDPAAFAALMSSTRGNGAEFAQVPLGASRQTTKWEEKVDSNGNVDYVQKCDVALAASLTNPQAGLAHDRLTHDPSAYSMPPAPGVMSNTTAAEMVELYWMAILRDQPISEFDGSASPAATMVQTAVDEINTRFKQAIGSNFVTNDKKFEKPVPPNSDGPEDRFILGVDVPGTSKHFTDFTSGTLFRLGFPGDEVGPMISQFFLRPVSFGTQTIDQRQRPYKEGSDYLTTFDDWLAVQNAGVDGSGQSYGKSNEDIFSDTNPGGRYEPNERYIATMRDLARFVNKDALHQAYFNAALILLSGGAKWPIGSPYHDVGNNIVKGALADREAGFGVLGGPHLLALVSEVATRALKVVWHQKWQVNLRLRPEAYGGLIHMQNIGEKGTKRDYQLPRWIDDTKVIKDHIQTKFGSMLLPMAFTAGSPTHPAYGAGHATVAGACVTILKAFFMTYTTEADGTDVPIAFATLAERADPFGAGNPIKAYRPTKPAANAAADETCHDVGKYRNLQELDPSQSAKLTIEGELNKLAQNVAMGRSMGGVHWRTDNTRSLMLGEALAAEILAKITVDVNERPSFTFRTFSRKADGQPKKVVIQRGRIFVDGMEIVIPVSQI